MTPELIKILRKAQDNFTRDCELNQERRFAMELGFLVAVEALFPLADELRGKLEYVEDICKRENNELWSLETLHNSPGWQSAVKTLKKVGVEL